MSEAVKELLLHCCDHFKEDVIVVVHPLPSGCHEHSVLVWKYVVSLRVTAAFTPPPNHWFPVIQEDVHPRARYIN